MSATGLHNEPLISANDRKRQRRYSAGELLSPVLSAKASNVPEHHQLPLVVTGVPVKPGDRVSAAKPAVRAARMYVLPPPLRCREALPKCREALPKCSEALLKVRVAPEAMLRRVRETPEVNRAGSTDNMFYDNTV
jgi:hypothetical protein